MSALLGKRIVCTGATGSELSLVDLLTSHVSEVYSYPCIAIAPVADPSELDASLASAADGAFTWITFTSVNAVEHVAHRLRVTGLNPPQARIAAIGTSTATALRLLPSPASAKGSGGEGTAVDFIPTAFTASALAEELPINPGDSVLIAQTDIAAPTLANGLNNRGASVTTVIAYQTTTGSGGIDLPTLLVQRSIDAVLFASPSAVNGCLERFALVGANADLLDSVLIVCIGPVTAEAARANGLTNLVVAPVHTRTGMAEALIAEFAAHIKGIPA